MSPQRGALLGGESQAEAYTLLRFQCHGPRGRREEGEWHLTVAKVLSQTPQAGGRECEGLNCGGVRAGDGQDQGQKEGLHWPLCSQQGELWAGARTEVPEPALCLQCVAWEVAWEVAVTPAPPIAPRHGLFLPSPPPSLPSPPLSTLTEGWYPVPA